VGGKQATATATARATARAKYRDLSAAAAKCAAFGRDDVCLGAWERTGNDKDKFRFVGRVWRVNVVHAAGDYHRGRALPQRFVRVMGDFTFLTGGAELNDVFKEQ
jgi:hypothetical protein